MNNEPIRPPYWVSTPETCPYKPGQTTSFLVLNFSSVFLKRHLEPSDKADLAEGGFRPNYADMAATFCKACNACVPYRVIASQFRPSANMRRSILKPNSDLRTTYTETFNRSARAMREYQDLFIKYQDARHNGNTMSKWRTSDVNDFVRNTSGTLEFRNNGDGRLMAAMFVHHMDAREASRSGLWAYYTIYDPDEKKRGLGTFAILKLIEESQNRGLGYTYLGTWIKGHPRMDYKKRFGPAEVYTVNGWEPFDPEIHGEGPDFRRRFEAGEWTPPEM